MMPDDTEFETDLNFAFICNGLVEGVVYDDEVRIHKLLGNVFIVEATSGDNELFSIGLSVIQGWHEDSELIMLPVHEINPFKHAATVLVGDE